MLGAVSCLKLYCIGCWYEICYSGGDPAGRDCLVPALEKNLGRGRPSSGGAPFPGGAPAATAPEPTQVEAMVACVHCGMHFPASEAIADSSGAIFCSAEHRRLHAS
ncbi:PP0621 family protein [Collimonas arenae]|uniref:PP0621 family protein n=1 Tax=Collimonas arenae TaxID=279058 RepID=UPI002FF4AF5D